jgi:cbb3-type cytochrome oxidase subunit 3
MARALHPFHPMTLYTEICSFENLYLAYRKARKGKRNKAQVAAFELNQEEELLRLCDEPLKNLTPMVSLRGSAKQPQRVSERLLRKAY